MRHYRDLGKTTSQRRWTPSSINCYERGCNCSGCTYEGFLESCKCQCKAAVLELVRTLGVPEKTIKIPSSQRISMIIELDKDGKAQLNKIAKDIEIESYEQEYLCQFVGDESEKK